MPKIVGSAATKDQRKIESAVWLDIAKHIEQTGRVPGGRGICYAAWGPLDLDRSYEVVRACFGDGWPFGEYHSAAGNRQRVIAATLLSLIVCTDQEPKVGDTP